jgi:hypothetical protein
MASHIKSIYIHIHTLYLFSMIFKINTLIFIALCIQFLNYISIDITWYAFSIVYLNMNIAMVYTILKFSNIWISLV